MTVVIVDSDKALVNATRGYELASEPQTLRDIRKCLYLDLLLQDLLILCIHFIYVKKQMFQSFLFLCYNIF